MGLYHKSEWKTFRDEVIELDGYKCKDCGRTSNEVVLQVHHKKYVKGKLPWEYPLQECETLCKGCHSARHGIIKPQIGWYFIGQEDLGDLNGTCENCGATIRHSFLIQHENWGAMEVGTFCCDKLTDSNLASNLLESQTSYKSRKVRFAKSKRWKSDENGNHKIKQSNFEIVLINKGEYFNIKIHNQVSSKKYDTLEIAKAKVFDVIESGEFIEYLDRHKITYREPKSKKKKKPKENDEKK
jgi:ribosomal protein S27AE